MNYKIHNLDKNPSMPQKGAIVLIDDDREDLNFICEGFKSLKVENEIICFENPVDFLTFLRKTKKNTFLILCDVNMPELNGLELREEIYKDEVLRLKAIPFLFLSTGNDPASIKKAYTLSVQGYFKKPSHFNAIKDLLQGIMNYWDSCLHPAQLKN